MFKRSQNCRANQNMGCSLSTVQITIKIYYETIKIIRCWTSDVPENDFKNSPTNDLSSKHCKNSKYKTLITKLTEINKNSKIEIQFLLILRKLIKV